MAAVYLLICIPRYVHEENDLTPIKFEENIKGNLAKDDNKDIIQDAMQYQLNKDKIGRARNSNKMIENTSLHKALKATIKRVGIETSTWMLSKHGRVYQVTFICEVEKLDEVLTDLNRLGIGDTHETIVSIHPCCIHRKKKPKYSSLPILEDLSLSQILSRKSQFIRSIKSRLTVAQVSEAVTQMATINFDFVIWLFVSCMLSSIGLAVNNSLMIAASMIVCPLMGPIMSGCFGVLIRNKKLSNLALKTEILGFSFCVVFGFVAALFFGFFANYDLKNGIPEWPTEEMKSRGDQHNLWIGLLVALLCGGACALATLGANIASWVGAAISASLLPPAVNTGMLWAYALIIKMKLFAKQRANFGELSFNHTDLNDTVTEIVSTYYTIPGYKYVYYPQITRELATLGIYSLILSIENVLGIFATGIIMLKIKEIVPAKISIMPATSFWKKDIKIARDYNKYTCDENGEEEKSLGTKLMEEWVSIHELDLSQPMMKDDEEKKVAEVVQAFKEMIEDIENDETYRKIIWTMSGKNTPEPLSQQLTMELLEVQDQNVTSSPSRSLASPILKRVYSGLMNFSSRHNSQRHNSQRKRYNTNDKFATVACGNGFINNSSLRCRKLSTSLTNFDKPHSDLKSQNYKNDKRYGILKTDFFKRAISLDDQYNDSDRAKAAAFIQNLTPRLRRKQVIAYENPLKQSLIFQERKRCESFKMRAKNNSNLHQILRRAVSAENEDTTKKSSEKLKLLKCLSSAASGFVNEGSDFSADENLLRDSLPKSNISTQQNSNLYNTEVINLLHCNEIEQSNNKNNKQLPETLNKNLENL